MKIAYIITAYKNPDQAVRLVRRLDSDDVSFFVHVDKKTPANDCERIVRPLSELSNVHFLRPHRCYWGGFGHVKATLKGIAEIERRGLEPDYAILLTGQDYPIASNATIKEFFRTNEGASFVAHFPLPTDEWEAGGLTRIERRHLRIRGRHYMVGGGRKVPLGLQPFGGSAYWCMSRSCVDYVHRFIRRNPAYARFFRYVDVPDEIFFQTIVLNSPLRASVVNDDLRYVHWRDWNDDRPAILGRPDFEKIMSSGKLFARKFDMHEDAAILDLIDEAIERGVTGRASAASTRSAIEVDQSP